MRLLDDAMSPLDPLFIVPQFPVPDYVHRQPIEAEIYRKLSLGGARIALVGGSGIGYSISGHKLPPV